MANPIKNFKDCKISEQLYMVVGLDIITVTITGLYSRPFNTIGVQCGKTIPEFVVNKDLSIARQIKTELGDDISVCVSAYDAKQLRIENRDKLLKEMERKFISQFRTYKKYTPEKYDALKRRVEKLFQMADRSL